MLSCGAGVLHDVLSRPQRGAGVHDIGPDLCDRAVHRHSICMSCLQAAPGGDVRDQVRQDEERLGHHDDRGVRRDVFRVVSAGKFWIFSRIFS